MGLWPLQTQQNLSDLANPPLSSVLKSNNLLSNDRDTQLLLNYGFM